MGQAQIKIDISTLADFGDGEATCWTEPEIVKATIENLKNGWVTSGNIVVWPSNHGVRLECKNLKQYTTANGRGESYYLIPQGVHVRLEETAPLTYTENGPYFWDDPDSGETYSFQIEGTLHIGEKWK